MTNHEQAAMDFLHSSAWLNAGDIFAQQKAIADFAASLAPRPSDSHKQAAREIINAAFDHPEDTMDGLHDAIAAALARVERETIERAAAVCDEREADGRDAEESAKKAGVPSAAFSYGTRGIEAKRCAAAIRALPGGSK